MKKTGYVWTVVKNLIALSIIFGVFSIANTAFETAVIAGLIIIYLNIESFFVVWGSTKMNQPPSQQDKEEFEKYITAKDAVEKKMLINNIFTVISYVVSVFMLIVAILE